MEESLLVEVMNSNQAKAKANKLKLKAEEIGQKAMERRSRGTCQEKREEEDMTLTVLKRKIRE